ncbi:MAG: hypothetical protein GXY03_00110 [Solirubrobacterales bacterium]|nr:hypothetical protein [Solirubrobacterales bacterium]
MAIEITGSGLGEPVVLEGDDAKRFVEETLNPTDPDGRRAEHFRKSAETYDRIHSGKTANELFAELQ